MKVNKVFVLEYRLKGTGIRRMIMREDVRLTDEAPKLI